MLNKIIIKKIPIVGLLEILNQLYLDGVDYIDIFGDNLTRSKDQISIGVRDEYYSQEVESVEGEKEENIEIVLKHLTDDDIKKLM